MVVDSEKMGGQGGDHGTANQSIVLAYSGVNENEWGETETTRLSCRYLLYGLVM